MVLEFDMATFNTNVDKAVTVDSSNITCSRVTNSNVVTFTFSGGGMTPDVELVGLKELFKNQATLTDVRFKSDIVTNFKPKLSGDCTQMFFDCTDFNPQDIGSWDTSNVTNMQYMFHGCASFNQPLNTWDTSKVEDMYGMFTYCSSFNQPLNNWDTSNVTAMSGMFFLCSSLPTLDVSGWDTSKVAQMVSMFAYCINLTSLDVSGWDTSNVTDMTNMFSGTIDSLPVYVADIPQQQQWETYRTTRNLSGTPVFKLALAAGGIGDPYICPIFGSLFKLPDRLASYRLLSGPGLVINARVTNCDPRELNARAIAFNDTFLRGSVPAALLEEWGSMYFFDQIFISYKGSTGVYNMFSQSWERGGFEHKTFVGVSKGVEGLYDNETARYCEMRLGDVTLTLGTFPNPQVRTGVTIRISGDAKGYDGMLVREYTSKSCVVKKLSDVKEKAHKRISGVKRTVHETFYTPSSVSDRCIPVL